MLDLELPDKTDHEAFMHWLGHEDWQGRALLLNLECVFVPAGGKTEVSVTASFDRRSGQLGLAVGVAAPAGRNHLVSSQIFDALDGLLATERLANIAAL